MLQEHEGMMGGHPPGPADLDFGDAVFDEDDWMDQDPDADADDQLAMNMTMDGADMYGMGDSGPLDGSLGMIEVPSFQEEMYGGGEVDGQRQVSADCCSVFGGGGRGGAQAQAQSQSQTGGRSFVERICGSQRTDNSYPQQSQSHSGQPSQQSVYNPIYKRK